MLNRTISGRFRCDRCGAVVDELPVKSQSHEYWGFDCDEDYIDDNHAFCGGTFESIENECKRCGEYCTDEEYDYSMCPKCKETVIHDISTFLRENYKTNEIECFLESNDF